ncbi:2-isopropylmalate synthase [Streptococcus pneumoniae]|nr:2-isopropylmalate synthase [Streptococcus pneumoniae]
MNFQLAKYSLLKKFSENIGFTTPEEYGAIFKYLIENVKTDRQIIYSPHCHDDLGIAVANSLAAVKNGAGRVEETINGIRERAGNAALEEIAVALNIRQDYYFDDLQLQTHADNDIEALVSLANMDGEKVEFNATGQGSVEAIFNAIDKFFNQSVRLVSYTIDAVTDGIDIQDRVLVTVENRDTETIFNATGLDFDVLKASAIVYINANTFVQKENAGEMGRSVSYHDMPSV